MFIKRQIFSQLVNHLDKKEITLLVGARQVGKTTLMKALEKHLQEKQQKTIFLNLDFEEDKIHFKTQLDFLNFLQLHLGNQKSYVFIDEIQRLTNAGLFLKGIYDRNLPYKFIVSGSGSLELKEKIHESLAGRKIIFEIFPLSFWEFINYKTKHQFENQLETFLNIHQQEGQQYLQEYLSFGGYPRVVTSPTIEEKRTIIRDIYQSYLEKDIKGFLNIEKTEEFTLLLELMSSQIGQLINMTKLSQQIKIHHQTLKRYLWYLEKTFILRKTKPFFSNPRKELTKMPLYYFEDVGLRNYAFNRWTSFNFTDGFLFQNFIFNILRFTFPFAKINFWRTKDKAEVDFILNYNNQIFPIEVKNQELTKIPKPHSLTSFINRYKPKYFFLINRNLNKQIKLGPTTLIALPYFLIKRLKTYTG